MDDTKTMKISLDLKQSGRLSLFLEKQAGITSPPGFAQIQDCETIFGTNVDMVPRFMKLKHLLDDVINYMVQEMLQELNTEVDKLPSLDTITTRFDPI